jgi:hypothetical protein
MINNLLNLQIPFFDPIFIAWGIPAGFSKLMILFSLITSFLISRLAISSALVVIPTSFLFLVFCAMGTHWLLQDVTVLGVDPFRKIMASLIMGQSIGGLLMMAFFKTGNKRIAGM